MESKQIKPWWTSDNLADDLWETFKCVERANQARIEDYKVFYRLYTNTELASFGPSGASTPRSHQRLTLNGVRTVIDTAASRLQRENPRAVFLTNGGNFSLQRKSRLLQKWVDHQRRETGFDRCAVDAGIDALIFGTGVVHTYSEGTKICTERVFPAELFTDPVESVDGKPRTMYRLKWIDRGVLKALFPAKAEEIADVSPEIMDGGFSYDSKADLVKTVMAWRLPPKEGGTGRYAMVVNGVELFSRPWKFDHFPFVFFRWAKDRRGFWGTGVTHELIALQVELNRSIAKLQKIVTLSAPQVWMEVQSMIKKQQMTNEIGAIRGYRGTPPTFFEGLPIPPGLVNYIEGTWNKMFAVIGVNQMFNGDRPPPGLDAAVAIQELADQGSMRFTLATRDWEWGHMDWTRQVLDLGAEVAKKHPDHRLVARRDQYTVDEVRWKDIDMAKDDYSIDLAPASSLPLSPAYRIQKVIDLYRNQLVDQQTAKRLINIHADLDTHMALDRAAEDAIDAAIEHILDTGKYVAPEPHQDHQLAFKKANMWLNRVSVMTQPPPRSHVDNLRLYAKQSQAYIVRAQAAQQQAALAAQPGVPLGPGASGQAPQAVTPDDGVL